MHEIALVVIVSDNVPGTGEAFRDQVSCVGATDVSRHSHRARQAEALQVGYVSSYICETRVKKRRAYNYNQTVLYLAFVYSQSVL